MDRPVALVPQATARRIQDMIRAGERREGELPPQRELSERLDVSRASLREALSVLEGSALHPWRFEKFYSPPASRIDLGRDVVVSTATGSELFAAPEAGDVQDAITSVAG